MKILVLILALALVVLAAGGIFFYLSFSVKPVDFVSQLDSDFTAEDLSGFDRKNDAMFEATDFFQKGQGQAAIYNQGDKNILRFENFSVTNGPDLYIYLSKEKDLTGLRPDIGEFISLGKLKNVQGEQTYFLLENYQDYPSVAIWSRVFGVMFAAAEFDFK